MSDERITLWQRLLKGLSRIRFIYLLIGFGVIYFFFLDENSIIELIKLDRQISSLKQEIKLEKEKLEENRKTIETILHDQESLETYAREKYFMKRPNEEVFILKEK